MSKFLLFSIFVHIYGSWRISRVQQIEAQSNSVFALLGLLWFVIVRLSQIVCCNYVAILEFSFSFWVVSWYFFAMFL